MPVLLPALPDPTDTPVQDRSGMTTELFVSVPSSAWWPTVQDDETVSLDYLSPWDAPVPITRVLFPWTRANGAIATGTGLVLPVDRPLVPFASLISESSQLWTYSGVTKDSTGAALGKCRVVVFETGRLAMDGAPIVAETISDANGNYSVTVPLNTAYQAIAYKPGSPDVAGITRSDTVPT